MTIGTSSAFLLFNLATATAAGLFMENLNKADLVTGALAGIFSCLFTLFGAAALVAKPVSGERSLLARIMGFAFLTPPALFILHTVSRFGAL